MNSKLFWRAALCASAILLGFSFGGSSAAQPQDPAIAVCATTPDLGALVKEIGGDQVSVTVFSKPTEDPHFLEAKPSFVKSLSQADLLVFTGLDLEVGYLPTLLQNARNDKVLRGAKGYIDASTVIQAREVPTGSIDRSMGDVHPYGNPHYLLDPLSGLRVAELLRDKLAETRSSKQKYFSDRYDAFRKKLAEALLGKSLAEKYMKEFEKLVKLHEYGKMVEFLKKKGDDGALDGWLKPLSPHHGALVVADHNLWVYFAARFGFAISGTMEPRPGIPPTTKHLEGLVETMKTKAVKLIFASPYYDPSHAKFLSEKTGAKVVTMAHQPGSRKGTDDYISMLDYNVKELASALGGEK